MRALALFFIIFGNIYLCVIPFIIVKYGERLCWEGFCKGAPFYEVYGVVSVVWIGGHAIAALFLWSLYGFFFIAKW